MSQANPDWRLSFVTDATDLEMDDETAIRFLRPGLYNTECTNIIEATHTRTQTHTHTHMNEYNTSFFRFMLPTCTINPCNAPRAFIARASAR